MAKLEMYQRNRGEWSDIIETDYYGGYIKHFKTSRKMLNMSDEKLNKIINTYESEVDDE